MYKGSHRTKDSLLNGANEKNNDMITLYDG